MIFLAFIRFTTGGIEYMEQFIVMAKDAESAVDKTMKHFEENYPESGMISCKANPMIL